MIMNTDKREGTKKVQLHITTYAFQCAFVMHTPMSHVYVHVYASFSFGSSPQVCHWSKGERTPDIAIL